MGCSSLKCYKTIYDERMAEMSFMRGNHSKVIQETEENKNNILSTPNNTYLKETENSFPSKFDKSNNTKKIINEINNNKKINLKSFHNDINKNNILIKNNDENINDRFFNDKFFIGKNKRKNNTDDIKIIKANSIEFKKPKYKNKDNNSLFSANNTDKLFEEFLKKENDYKLKIKELEKIIANYKEPILIGLNNIGATCYMNATLQCLSNTKKLTDYFLNIFKNDDPNKIMSNEYYKVLLNLCKEENNKKSYSPYSFKEVLSKENPLFAGISGNDSIDLINFLLERFHQELNITNNV